MTVERSKRRFLIPIVFTTKCFKKPLLITKKTFVYLMNIKVTSQISNLLMFREVMDCQGPVFFSMNRPKAICSFEVAC